jgi:tetratricopeptide (TPR) repeat protein
MKRTFFLLLVCGGFCAKPTPIAAAASQAQALKTLRAVSAEGAGNAEATAAWKVLAQADARSLPAILAGMDGANELALNWLRAAVDSIAARELAAGRKLPVAALEKFVRDTKHHPRARYLAYDVIGRVDAAKAESLIAALQDDPSTELRRDAVQRRLDAAAALAKAGKTNDAVAQYQTAIKSARDAEQVEGIAKELKRLGSPVSLPGVFGWVTDWKVIGPFDNKDRAGFEKVFPPEQAIDLNAEYDGLNGKVKWQDFKVTDDYGKVDLNKPFGSLKEVTGYACAEFHAAKARPVELRLGCKNGWKVWLNGKFLFGRDEYHRGAEIDQYRLAGELRPGKNVILVKLTQNEQKEDWTKEWEFQMRLTDALGTPIVSAKR